MINSLLQLRLLTPENLKLFEFDEKCPFKISAENEIEDEKKKLFLRYYLSLAQSLQLKSESLISQYLSVVD